MDYHSDPAQVTETNCLPRGAPVSAQTAGDFVCDSLKDLKPAAPVRCWLDFLRPPRSMRKQLLSVSLRVNDCIGALWRWPLIGVLFGVLPLFADYLLGWSLHQWITPLAVLPVLVAAAARDAWLRGVGFMAALLASHCTLAVALSAYDPERMALVLPGGQDYWIKSHRWICGFENPEYHPSSWLPAQIQLLASFLLYGLVSLGAAPLWQGFHELGLMNFYVGRLAAHSDDPALAVLLGWHPWSLCRGLGYLLLTFEVCSLALAWLTATELSTRSRRLARWGLGLSFLALDVVIKYYSMGAIRELLAANLSEV